MQQNHIATQFFQGVEQEQIPETVHEFEKLGYRMMKEAVTISRVQAEKMSTQDLEDLLKSLFVIGSTYNIRYYLNEYVNREKKEYSGTFTINGKEVIVKASIFVAKDDFLKEICSRMKSSYISVEGLNVYFPGYRPHAEISELPMLVLNSGDKNFTKYVAIALMHKSMGSNWKDVNYAPLFSEISLGDIIEINKSVSSYERSSDTLFYDVYSSYAFKDITEIERIRKKMNYFPNFNNFSEALVLSAGQSEYGINLFKDFIAYYNMTPELAEIIKKEDGNLLETIYFDTTHMFTNPRAENFHMIRPEGLELNLSFQDYVNDGQDRPLLCTCTITVDVTIDDEEEFRERVNRLHKGVVFNVRRSFLDSIAASTVWHVNGLRRSFVARDDSIPSYLAKLTEESKE